MYLAHATVNNKVGSIDKAALVTGQEDHRMSLLNGLSEPSHGEMHFAAVTLGLVITQPVLQEWSAGSQSDMSKPDGRKDSHTSTVPGTVH